MKLYDLYKHQIMRGEDFLEGLKADLIYYDNQDVNKENRRLESLLDVAKDDIKSFKTRWKSFK